MWEDKAVILRSNRELLFFIEQLRHFLLNISTIGNFGNTFRTEQYVSLSLFLVASCSNNIIQRITKWAMYGRYFLMSFSFIHRSYNSVCEVRAFIRLGCIFGGIKCNACECRTKEKEFSRREKLRQCHSFHPAVFPASIGNRDKRKVVKSVLQRSSLEGWEKR